MPDQPGDELKLVVTRDGSHTVYSSRFDQHYHNPNGAVAESRYVFFEQTGLLDELADRQHITVLEVGFGTGLNFLLLMDYCLSSKSTGQIDYYTIEGFPLTPQQSANLNYGKYLNYPELTDHIPHIFNTLSDGINHFTPFQNIELHFFNGMFADFNLSEINANYIFHDAFSPDANPDLWTAKVFKTIKGFSTDDVMLSTYCAASKAQGALARAGWKVAKTHGALGKREMILAALGPQKLADFKRINEERYARRYEEGDFD